MSLIIGIDPGHTGAIAFLCDGEATVIDMPTVEVKKGKGKKTLLDLSRISKILRDTDDNMEISAKMLVVVEAQQAYPKQGGVSNYSIGHGYGAILGILAGLKIPYQTVHPKTWQKTFGIHGGDKEAGCLIAERLFPELELRKRTGKAKDGRSDAVLIALFGQRVLSAAPK